MIKSDNEELQTVTKATDLIAMINRQRVRKNVVDPTGQGSFRQHTMRPRVARQEKKEETLTDEEWSHTEYPKSVTVAQQTEVTQSEGGAQGFFSSSNV